MKNMSQWQNRFHVLDNQMEFEEESDTEVQTMPKEHFSSLASYLDTFSERIYVRSTSSKTSTQLPVVLKVFDIGAILLFWIVELQAYF